MAETIGGWWLASSVELEDGETVRYRSGMMLRQRGEITGVPGELLLTSSRLVWIRRGFALPFVRRLLKVPLGRIEGWSVERVPWWIRWSMLWSIRRMVRVRTTSEVFDLIPVDSSEGANEWAEALDNVMTDAGMARRGSRK
jgi:hypothetical protein